MKIKVKDLVEYLLKQKQEAEVLLDKDGWLVEKYHTNPQEVIESRDLFQNWKRGNKDYVIQMK